MQFKLFLEEYCIRKGDAEIFLNPSLQEIRDLKAEDGVRFIADSKNKQIFVWSIGHGSIHYDTSVLLRSKGYLKHLDKYEDFYSDPYILGGIAETEPNGKLFATENHDIEGGWPYRKKAIIGKLTADWSWMERYFVNLDEYLNKYKQKYDIKKK